MCNARACDAPGMIPTLSDGSRPNFTISEMALRILAYNLTRVMNIMGSKPLLARISAETAAPTPRTDNGAGTDPTPTRTEKALLHSRAQGNAAEELLEHSGRPQARCGLASARPSCRILRAGERGRRRRARASSEGRRGSRASRQPAAVETAALAAAAATSVGRS